MKVEYRNSILEDYPEECPTSCIVRYSLDKDNWIDVATTPRGVEIRTSGGKMAIEPWSGNNVEIYLKERS